MAEQEGQGQILYTTSGGNVIGHIVPTYWGGQYATYVETVRQQTRTVFVGYPYKIPAADYRPVFEAVSDEYKVQFVFADDELTSKHILEKIAGLIESVDFSLFDITYWNPNVALELGIAYGRGLDFYILFDPTKDAPDVLSDLRGIDRIEYRTHAELRKELDRLMRDQYGPPEQKPSKVATRVLEQIESLRERVPKILADEPGQPIGSIAEKLEVPIELAQTIVRPLVGDQLETRGVRRGMKYYVKGDAPPEIDPVREPTLNADLIEVEIEK